MEAMNLLEKEKGINRSVLFEAIETALLKACENDFGVSDNITVNIDKDTCEFSVFQNKKVVETVADKAREIALKDALLENPSVQLGDVIQIKLESKKFGRIAAQNAKSIILQKIREEDRNNINDYFSSHAHDIMTGVVQRVMSSGNVQINLGKADAILSKDDIIPGETFVPTQHVKVYVVGMRDGGGGKGPRVQISRTKANMVRRLFELDVPELRDGTVQIRAISREAGSRTKMAVSTNDDSVDPIGACIGVNGSRINPIVAELHGEKIDIIHWDDNPAYLVENALSPAKVIAVAADEDDHTALVVVPDNQLSLAIGMKGQNARLAAKLTGYKIDIKSEKQAREEGIFDEIDEYEDDDYSEEGYADASEGESESYDGQEE